MKTFISLLVLAAAFPCIRGQELPPCASTCAINGVSATGCAPSDAKCICQNAMFLSTVTTCVSQTCSAADQQRAYSFAQAFCNNAQVTLSLPSPSGPTSTTLTPATSKTSTTTTSSASKTSSNSTVTPTKPPVYPGEASNLKGSFMAMVAAFSLALAMEL